MLKSAVAHLKFELLCSELCVPKWQAIGILEALWLFAQYHAIDGDLSQFSGREIAAWMQYQGNPDELFEALVCSGWVDRDGSSLVIHDWADHAPNWVKGSLKTTLSRDGRHNPAKRNAKRSAKRHAARVGLGRVGSGKAGEGAPQGVAPNDWRDWLAARKAKRLAPPTEAVMARVTREAAKAGLTIGQAVRLMAEKSWGNLGADWVKETDRPSTAPRKPDNGICEDAPPKLRRAAQ